MKRDILNILLFVVLFFALIWIIGCSKEIVQEQLPACQAVTYTFKETGELIIHWHNVCGEDLVRFRELPKESVVSWCDSRIMILSIGNDTCKNY